jgi:hypothetical protein
MRRPALPLGVSLSAPNQRLASAVRMQIQVSNVERHQFAAPGKRFVGDAEKRPFAIGSQPFPGVDFIILRPIISTFCHSIRLVDFRATD